MPVPGKASRAARRSLRQENGRKLSYQLSPDSPSKITAPVAEYERRVDGEFVPDGIIRAHVPPRGDREKAALVHEMLRRAPVFLRHGSAVLRAECVVKIRNEQISFKFSVSHWYFSQNYV